MSATRKKIPLIFLGLVFVVVMSFMAYWHLATPVRTCGSCHEIQTSIDVWAKSAHRDIKCTSCHGGTFSYGLHSLTENSNRLLGHFVEERSNNMLLSEKQILRIIENCRKCHRNEYADWLSGGHSVTYEAIFLNETHNRTEQLNADCLRCHGMFYQGDINSLVGPLDVTGPWHLKDSEKARQPAIPCLACHTIHIHGHPAVRPDYDSPQQISARRQLRVPPSGFYDEREKLFFAAELLPVLEVSNNQKPVSVSDDSRQRICVQCHAPNARHEAGSGDDRTPRGVHEGLSCGACHELHSNEARRSCSNCHPAASNCGLDVETMNTTCLSQESPNNIHFVACSDCHVDSVPGR